MPFVCDTLSSSSWLSPESKSPMNIGTPGAAWFNRPTMSSSSSNPIQETYIFRQDHLRQEVLYHDAGPPWSLFLLDHNLADFISAAIPRKLISLIFREGMCRKTPQLRRVLEYRCLPKVIPLKSKIPMIPKISYFENGDMPEKLVTLSQRTTPDAST